MPFIQTIQFRTTHFDEVYALEHQWRRDTDGKRTLRRSILLRDRNDADHYTVIAFFDSYDAAQKNSALPETAAFAQRLQSLAEGVTFFDGEVVEDFT